MCWKLRVRRRKNASFVIRFTEIKRRKTFQVSVVFLLVILLLSTFKIEKKMCWLYVKLYVSSRQLDTETKQNKKKHRYTPDIIQSLLFLSIINISLTYKSCTNVPILIERNGIWIHIFLQTDKNIFLYMWHKQLCIFLSKSTYLKNAEKGKYLHTIYWFTYVVVYWYNAETNITCSNLLFSHSRICFISFSLK